MRNVLVTGGAKGIGEAIVRLFAENGDRVFVNYCHSKDAADHLCRELSGKGCQVFGVCADVADSTAVTKMFRNIEDQTGGIDVLVNNAGIAQTKLFTKLTDQDWFTMLNTNLSSAFFCCRAALPYMIRQHSGRIVNISSMWGQVGGSCEVHYSAAKAGMIGLTKALAMEEGLSGITVNCVAPGVIKTDMLASYSGEDLQKLADETPVGSLGTPSDIARAVFFLAAAENSFITGQVLGVNGGFVV